MRSILRRLFFGRAAPGKKIKVKIRDATDTGKVRSHNEDYHAALEGKESPPGVDALLVVADGMGGHAAGEVASKMTVDGILERLANRSGEALKLEGNAFGAYLSRVLKEVNQDVFQAGQDPDKRGMGTTCTLAAVRGDQLFLAHIGDSRAYLLRNGELHQVSTDHSWVEEAVAMGTLTREEARIHPNRNVITRAIGLDPQIEVDTLTMPLAEGDLLLLCSDGLNSMLSDNEIKGLLVDQNPEKVCQALIDAANNQGGHDNTTVVVATIGSKGTGMTKLSLADRDTEELMLHSSRWKTAVRAILRRK